MCLKPGWAAATHQSGSGTKTPAFAAPPLARTIRPVKLELDGGAIVATEAAGTLRLANLSFPAR